MENSSIVQLRFRPYVRAVQAVVVSALMAAMAIGGLVSPTVATLAAIGGIIGATRGSARVEIGPGGVKVQGRRARPWSDVSICERRGHEMLRLGEGRCGPGIVFAQFTRDWRTHEIAETLRRHVPSSGEFRELHVALGLGDSVESTAPPGYVHFDPTGLAPPGA